MNINSTVKSIKKFANLTVSWLFAGVEKLRLTPYAEPKSIAAIAALTAVMTLPGVAQTTPAPEVKNTSKGQVQIIRTPAKTMVGFQEKETKNFFLYTYTHGEEKATLFKFEDASAKKQLNTGKSDPVDIDAIKDNEDELLKIFDQMNAQPTNAQEQVKDPGTKGTGGISLKNLKDTIIYPNGNKEYIFDGGSICTYKSSGRLELYGEDGVSVVAEITPIGNGYNFTCYENVKNKDGTTYYAKSREYDVVGKVPDQNRAFKVMDGKVESVLQYDLQDQTRYRLLSPEEIKKAIKIDFPGMNAR